MRNVIAFIGLMIGDTFGTLAMPLAFRSYTIASLASTFLSQHSHLHYFLPLQQLRKIPDRYIRCHLNRGPLFVRRRVINPTGLKAPAVGCLNRLEDIFEDHAVRWRYGMLR